MAEAKRKQLRFKSARQWTPQDDLWQEEARRWEVGALPTLRAAADRWAAGLGVLLGGSGIALLLSGPGELTRLAHCYEAWAKGVLFAAGVSATIALLAALIAGGVTMKTLFLTSGSSLRRANHEAVKSAVRWLRLSRAATGVALSLSVVVAALLFFAPQG